MDFSFEKPYYLLLLLLLPLLWWGFWRYDNWKKSLKENFEPETRAIIFGKTNFLNRLFISFIFILLPIGLSNPLSDVVYTKVKNKTADLVIALDLSNSMNCQDVSPSRLEKSKKFILELLNKLNGNRVAMVVFAREAYTIMPFTSDYTAVSLYVETLQTELIQRQGTRLYDAIEEVNKQFKQDALSKPVILISDGEDLDDTADAAFDLAKKSNLTLFTLGVGTEQGSIVPRVINGSISGVILDENGEAAISFLQEKNLKKLASKTGGFYHKLEDTNVAIEAIQFRLQQLEGRSISENQTLQAKSWFQWFLAPVLALLIIVFLTQSVKRFNI